MDKNESQDELNFNKSKWESKGINNYCIKLEESCNCMMNGTYLIVVKNNIVDTVMPDTNLFPEINKNQYDHVTTIDSIFKFIQYSITDNAERLIVVYNEEYGYPEKVEIDMNLNYMDDEHFMEIKEFIKE
jgi:hypothetical protein